VIVKFVIFPFYDNISAKKSDIQMKERELEKDLKFIQKQAEFQQTLKRLAREEQTIQSSLLQGETSSLAAADIQKIVEKSAESSGLEIKSVKVIEPGTRENFITIPIQVMFASDLSRMDKFIKSIENNRKLLTIPELKIRVKNPRRPEDISVTLIISGVMKKTETNI
jgi:Tfp pilus assembly protein PilO